MSASSIVAALCALLSLGSAPPPDCRIDARYRVDRAGMLPVGVVSGGQNVGHGTGVLVGECIVLTAKHVGGRVANPVGRRMSFTVPIPGRPAAQSDGTIVAAGDFDPRIAVTPYRSQDWMLIQLDRCLGRTVGTMRLDPRPLLPHSEVYRGSFPIQSAGFPADRRWQDGATVDPHCQLLQESRTLMFNDCCGTFGSSGGPIFVRQPARDGGSFVVLGIQTAGADTGAAGQCQPVAKIATPVAGLRSAIEPYLRPSDRTAA